MRRRALQWLIVKLGPLLLTLWYSTIRLRWCGGSYLHPDPRTRKHAIFVFWHQRLLCFGHTHARYRARLLISRSRDGELVSGLVAGLGFKPIRGSSHRAGGVALRSLLAEAKSGYDFGITPDGPRGPSQVFKSGAVYLASRSGLPIIPITVSYHRYWRLKSWDRFQVPWPFTWGVVHVGAPVSVPEGLDQGGLESWRARLEEVLRDHTRDTDARLAEIYQGSRRRRDL